MNTKHLFGITTLAAAISFSAFSAHAASGEVEGPLAPAPFQSTRSVADVRAEAMNPVRISNGGTGFIGLTQSTLTPEAVRAQARQSVRDGQFSKGELGLM